ncbi:glycosyl hydrolase family 18 protein [Mucilaginibacter myungsuensis]
MAQQSKFRVVGYLRKNDIENGNAATVDLDKVKVINIAFINPDKNGELRAMPSLKAFVDQAHQKNVKVLAAIGGGSAPAYYTDLLSDSLRAKVTAGLVKFVIDNDLDGLDVDLEGSRIDGHYEAFVIALADALKPKGKLITAAVATGYKYTDAALQRFDFINIMSYDKTGPWRPANAGQHSPYDMAVSDLQHWVSVKKISKEKLNIGLPFYGYGFGARAPADASYRSIINKYPDAHLRDTVGTTGGGVIYYNGAATITAKTNFALAQAGGVMIWQLLQDATGPHSLLNIIDRTIKTKNTK